MQNERRAEGGIGAFFNFEDQKVAELVDATNVDLLSEGKGQILDHTLHSLEEDSLIALEVDHSDYSLPLSRGGDGIGQIRAVLVDGDQLSGQVLIGPAKIDDVVELKLRRSNIVIARGERNNVDLITRELSF